MVWDRETIGQRIRRIRNQQGLTQEGLGQLSGMSGFTINRIETAEAPIYGEFVEGLAGALRVSETYLLRGDTRP